VAAPPALPDEHGVTAIARACGLTPRAAAPLADGVSTVAWRVETGGEALVVSVERPASLAGPRRVRAAFEARASLLERLHPRDPRVPRAIVTHADVDPRADPLGGRLPWAVTSFVDGRPLGAGDPPARPDPRERAARELGTLLRALHALPASGWGMLADERGAPRGVAGEPAKGLLVRWPGLWPFDGRPLIAHPIAPAAPHLVGALAALREPLLRWGDPTLARAICHGDLTPTHVLSSPDGALAGLIDFGDAMVAAPAWDLAGFAWHHGWPLLSTLLEGYEPRRLRREILLAEAQQLSIALALRYYDRDAASGRGGERAVRFIEETLPLAIRRDA